MHKSLIKKLQLRYVGGVIVLMAVVLAGCTPSGDMTPTLSAPVVAVKQLATVVIPPTPDAAQRQATLLARPQSPTPIPPTPTFTNTPYVGVFLGTPNEGEGALVDLGDLPTQPPDTFGTNCTIGFDLAFGTGWRENPLVTRRVGCPLQERFGFAANAQLFEGGVMYRRLDTGELWAIQPGNISAGEYWYFNQVPLIGFTSGEQPPQGLRAPADLFGAVWLSSQEIYDAFGFATTDEQPADVNIQRFDGGSLFLDVNVGRVFVLLDNGAAFGPY